MSEEDDSSFQMCPYTTTRHQFSLYASKYMERAFLVLKYKWCNERTSVRTGCNGNDTKCRRLWVL